MGIVDKITRVVSSKSALYVLLLVRGDIINGIVMICNFDMECTT